MTEEPTNKPHHFPPLSRKTSLTVAALSGALHQPIGEVWEIRKSDDLMPVHTDATRHSKWKVPRFPEGPCEVCGKPNVASGRLHGVYRCGEHLKEMHGA